MTQNSQTFRPIIFSMITGMTIDEWKVIGLYPTVSVCNYIDHYLFDNSNNPDMVSEHLKHSRMRYRYKPSLLDGENKFMIGSNSISDILFTRFPDG